MYLFQIAYVMLLLSPKDIIANKNIALMLNEFIVREQ